MYKVQLKNFKSKTEGKNFHPMSRFPKQLCILESFQT